MTPKPLSKLMVVSVMSPTFTSVRDFDRLRDVVRGSRLAIGLIAFPSRAFIELSGPALELTGLRAAETPVDPDVEQTFAIMLMDVADDPDRIADRLIGLEASLATNASGPIIGRLHGGNGAAAVDSNQRLAELETRFRRIAEEIDAAGLFDARPAAAFDAFPGLDDLTGRQREILTRLLRGDRVPTISRGMHLAASTVRNHLTTIYRKVGVHSQADLIERLHSQAYARRS
jgi:DNA-binding CsgD family transcriptional regulator